MYIEANVHGNEIQGAEVVPLHDLVPDGALRSARRASSSSSTSASSTSCRPSTPTAASTSSKVHSGGRSGHVPVDSDNDGVADEDDVDDLNGNGVIEQMRKLRAGAGHAPHQQPSIRGCSSRRPPGATGDYVLLGFEGLDNDGDGLRQRGRARRLRSAIATGPSDWQPNYIQNGSMDYPFQLPEARAVSDFLMAQPEHRRRAVVPQRRRHDPARARRRGAGRVPGGRRRASTTSSGGRASACCPYYRYLVIWSGLYTVHGGFIDWTNDGLGIAVVLERAVERRAVLQQPGAARSSSAVRTARSRRASPSYFFDDMLEFGDRVRRVEGVRAPDVRQGRDRRLASTRFGRVPPRFMNEELCHRNMAFSLYQADEMPQMKLGDADGRGARRRRVAGARADVVNDQADADDPGQGRSATTSCGPIC